MSALIQNLRQVWDQLRGQNSSRADRLEEVAINGLRGIRELRVSFPYPVCVLAGANGCGKSTVLQASACAYAVPRAPQRELTPAALFPDFRTANGMADARGPVSLEFSYVTASRRQQMRWARGAGSKWNRSYFGQKQADQPVRGVYLRTLANLTNPAEVRSVLQIGRRPCEKQEVDAATIAFAQRILSFRYSRLSHITSGARSLLFAERSDANSPTAYSEFHMSAGERALLRLSMDLSRLTNALVLIDEVEAGLHPHIQEVLLLELQRLALRNQLQIVVTSHSPVVLETVPPEGRIFLERADDTVRRREAFRDVLQRALYGRSLETLSFLCEDEVAEAVIRGVLDVLNPEVDLTQNDIDIGRDSGKDEFPAHLETLARFRKLDDVVFVLDGDGQDLRPKLESRAKELGQVARILILPGANAPEHWLWECLLQHPIGYAAELGLTEGTLIQKLTDLQRLYESAADKPAAIIKNMLAGLAEACSRRTTDLARMIARTEAGRNTGPAAVLRTELMEVIGAWRSMER